MAMARPEIIAAEQWLHEHIKGSRTWRIDHRSVFCAVIFFESVVAALDREGKLGDPLGAWTRADFDTARSLTAKRVRQRNVALFLHYFAILVILALAARIGWDVIKAVRERYALNTYRAAVAFVAAPILVVLAGVALLQLRMDVSKARRDRWNKVDSRFQATTPPEEEKPPTPSAVDAPTQGAPAASGQGGAA